LSFVVIILVVVLVVVVLDVVLVVVLVVVLDVVLVVVLVVDDFLAKKTLISYGTESLKGLFTLTINFVSCRVVRHHATQLGLILTLVACCRTHGATQVFHCS
jgi:hypothetical protein